MALQQTRVFGPAALATTTNSSTPPANYSYEAGLNETIIIKQMIFTNTSASAQTIDLWLTPAGTVAPAASHKLFASFTVAANETTLVNFSLVVAYDSNQSDGDKIWVRASTASVVNMTINAIVETP